jgi:3-hydroxymyristoyl/3-hydroxydecanoyl-(acyl carrier protein) dehydratases
MRQRSFSYKELLDCSNGILFGKGNAQLPAPPMLMFDRVTDINETGGVFEKGEIVAELDIKPRVVVF